MKKAISLVLSIVMLITMMSVGFSAYADAPKTFYVYSAVGDYEENVFEDVDAAYWEEQYGIANYFDSKDGTLYIYGKNKIPNHYLSPNIYYARDYGEAWKMHYKLNEEHIEFMRKNVKSIVICEGITGIGVAAFANIFDNVESVYIPSTVNTIDYEAFARMKKLNSLHIAEGVKHINVPAFCDCDSLTEVTLPKSLKTIDISQDQEVQNLRIHWYDIYDGETSPFDHCDNLKKIVCLSDNLAFGYIAVSCPSLETIVLASHDLGEVVYRCPALKDIYFLTKNNNGAGAQYIVPLIESAKLHPFELDKSITEFDYWYGDYQNATIHCYRESQAHQIFSHITNNIQFLDAAKVTGLKVDKAYVNSVKLSWKKCKSGATAYEVQRYMNQARVWKTVAVTDSNTCTVKNLCSCDTYKFRVRTVNKTDYTDEKGEYCKAIKAITKTAPVTVTATAKSGKIKIHYDKSYNATEYEIYIKSGKNGKYQKLATTKKLNYTTKRMKKGTYYIKVRARKKLSNGKYNYSAYSKEVKIKVS